MSSDEPREPEAPLVRALALAQGLRATFDLEEINIAYLLGRWRTLAEVPLADHHLALVARMVRTDDVPPLSNAEARRVLHAAADEFRHDTAAGRATLRAWCIRRGNVSPSQIARLEQLYVDLVSPREQAA
jgi:hypothetical protein